MWIHYLVLQMWKGKVRAIYSTTYTAISSYIPKIHPASLISEQQSPNW